MLHDIGVIFIVCGVLVWIFKKFDQPLIPALVLGGLLVGPMFLGFVEHLVDINHLSEMAIAILLFLIGIEMDIQRLKRLGLIAILGGTLQVVGTFILGFLLAKCFSFNLIESVYLGFALAFSSTMLVVKVMGENHNLESLEGRIVVGILVMQDICAIFALAILNTVNNFSPGILLDTITQAAGLILIIVFLFGRFVLPKVFEMVAGEREALGAISMAVLFFFGFYAEKQSLSLGIGAFLSGLAIAKLAYKHEIIGDLESVKSFFTVLFFASLGLQIAPEALFMQGAARDGFLNRVVIFSSNMADYVPMIIVFALSAIFLKSLFVMVLVRAFGYEKSTAFKVGISLGQFSEFGLILVAHGILIGHLKPAFLPPLILATVISMTISSYILKFTEYLYFRSAKVLGWLEKITLVNQDDFNFESTDKNSFEVVLFGRDRIGRIIENHLRRSETSYVVVDHNPEVIAKLEKEGIPFIFGSANNMESLNQIDFKKIRIVFSTIPNIKDAEFLIGHIKKINPQCSFICATDSRREAEELYEAGAHYVIVTYMYAGVGLNPGVIGDAINLDHLLGKIKGFDIQAAGQRHRGKLRDEDFLSALT